MKSIQKYALKLGQLLITKGCLTDEQLEMGLLDQKKTKEPLREVLLRRGFVTDKMLFDALSEQFGLAYISLKEMSIAPSVISQVPVRLACHYQLLPVEAYNNTLTVALAKPLNIHYLDDLRLMLHKDIKVVLAKEEDITESIKKYYINTLSSSRITALNNQEAKILVGESRPYATNSVVQGSNTTTTATTLTFIEVGVKLFVKPTINQDGFVSMKIRPEISSVSGSYTYGSPATTVPIVSTTQAETTVSVKDRQTIIIAGLIKDERTGAVDKIPYLGDLPVLGNIFRKTDNEVKKQEIVIFLTPRIITGDSDYMEIPPSKMPEEKNFTMTEKGTFERRGQLFENPGLFKETSPFSTDQSAATTTFNKQIIPNSVEEYYYLLKNKIVENIRLPKSNNGKSAKGTVKLSFYLNADGRLASMPEIRESSNPSLDDAAKEAVKKSEPFQAFPSQLSQPKKQFIVDLVFE